MVVDLGADQHPAAEVEDSRQEAGVRREEYQQAQPQVQIQPDKEEHFHEIFYSYFTSELLAIFTLK